MENKKISDILEYVKNNEIEIIDFIFENKNKKEKKISLDSSFFCEDLIKNGFETPDSKEKIFINKDLSFINFLNSKPSLQFFCQNESDQYLQKLIHDLFIHKIDFFLTKSPEINFFIEKTNENENIFHDLCAEIFEYSRKIDSKFFFQNRPKSFAIEDLHDHNKKYKNIFIYLNFCENLSFEKNLINLIKSIWILEKLIKNISRNFGFEAIFSNENIKDINQSNKKNIKINFKSSVKDSKNFEIHIPYSKNLLKEKFIEIFQEFKF